MTNTENTLDQRYADTQRFRYADAVSRVAQQLRNIADEVEREGKVRPGTFDNDGQDDFNWSAQQVTHTLMWGMANLNLDGLLSAANDAHNAVRGRTK